MEELQKPEQLAQLDLFNRLQLESVLEVCQNAKSLADSGRKLFQAFRNSKQTRNNSDHIRKYLRKYGLNWIDIS